MYIYVRMCQPVLPDDSRGLIKAATWLTLPEGEQRGSAASPQQLVRPAAFRLLRPAHHVPFAHSSLPGSPCMFMCIHAEVTAPSFARPGVLSIYLSPSPALCMVTRQAWCREGGWHVCLVVVKNGINGAEKNNSPLSGDGAALMAGAQAEVWSACRAGAGLQVYTAGLLLL